MNLLSSLSKLKRNPKLAGVRKYTNLLYYDPEWVNVKLSNFDVVEVDGCRFKVTDQINAIQRVKGNKWFDGVRPTDTVVDIGANIGAITIPLARVAKQVYAFEPLYHQELRDNIALNSLNNTVVFPVGIGNGDSVEIEFGGKKATVNLVSFGELKVMVDAPIDFLKLDGEGCEWDIEPSELKGIRELRIEFHIARGKKQEHQKKYNRYVDWLAAEGYNVVVTDDGDGCNPYFIGHPEMRASLK
jgi:hypothetical protein